MPIKLGLILSDNQYIEIKVTEGSKSIKEIKTNLKSQEEDNNKGIVLKATLLKTISVKSNNQRLIAFAHNLIYHTQTKHINIKYHYICNKVAARRSTSNTFHPTR